MEEPDVAVVERRKALWQWFIMEESLLISRLNFFLVVEALLFAAFTSAATSPSARRLAVALVVVGTVTSLTWAYSAFIQIRFTIRHLHVKLMEIDTDFLDIVEKRQRVRYRMSVNNLIGLCLPLFLAVVWIALAFL